MSKQSENMILSIYGHKFKFSKNFPDSYGKSIFYFLKNHLVPMKHDECPRHVSFGFRLAFM